MNGRLAVGIIAAAFIVSLFVGNYLMLFAHESSHAIVLISAGIPFDFSVNPYGGINHCLPLASVPESTYQIFNLAGGIGAAIVMGLLFFVIFRLEKKNKNKHLILAAVGVEAVFLYFTFYGIENALWEGLLTENYHNYALDPLGRAILIGSSLGISLVLLVKLRLGIVKQATVNSNKPLAKT